MKKYFLFAFVGFVMTNSCANSPKNFDETVKVITKPGLVISKEYPGLNDLSEEPVYVTLYFGRLETRKLLGVINEASFYDIPREYVGKKVRAEINSRYWKISNDSVFLSKTGTTEVAIEPNDAIAHLTIVVKTMDGNGRIPFARIQIGNDTSMLTDTNGTLNFTPPVKMRRGEFWVYAYKKGYRCDSGLYLLSSEEAYDLRLKKN